MARYVDGFLLPVPKKNLGTYRRIAKVAAKVWRQHGALDYVESVGDDLACPGHPSFEKRAACKRGEVAVFSYITYRSRAHRDRVNAKVMKDPRMVKMMEMMSNPKTWPFDMKRMSYGGFRVLVEA